MRHRPRCDEAYSQSRYWSFVTLSVRLPTQATQPGRFMDQHLRRDDAAGFLASLAVADRAALVELGRSVYVSVSRSDSDGATLALGLRSAGDVLGLAELFTGADRVVEAYADQPSDVLRVPA